MHRYEYVGVPAFVIIIMIIIMIIRLNNRKAKPTKSSEVEMFCISKSPNQGKILHERDTTLIDHNVWGQRDVASWVWLA